MRTTLLPRLMPGVRTALPPDVRPQVLLTFDDGPAPGPTQKVLALLARHGARAVFFLVGRNVVRHPELVREITAAGHLVGNHTHTHSMARWQSPAAFQSDVQHCNTALRDAGVTPTMLLRPPGGRLHPAALLVSRRLGLRIIHWSVDSGDWRCDARSDSVACAQQIVAATRARDIVLLHDYTEVSVQILSELLPRLVDRGFDLAGGADHLIDDGDWR